MSTWLADFQEKSPLTAYPVALRTRGGIGYRLPGGQIESNFVGHPVHYLNGNRWEPITLKHDKGQFEGSDFGWNGYAVTYKKKVLYTPTSITFNGVVRPLNFFLDADNHRVVAYVQNIGEYQILFSECGVKEILTIPEPLEGVLSFQVVHAEKPKELFKKERHIIGGSQFGDEYTLTADMTYPLVIDPNYAGHTGDGVAYGVNATYSTARSTSSGAQNDDTFVSVGQYKPGDYYVFRAYLKFATSGIPDGDTISQVNLNLVCINNYSVADFDVVIKKYNWATRDPLASYAEQAYDECLAATADDNIWRNTSGISTNTQYTSGNLATTWPSKTTYTYYGLQSSQDIANTAPTDNAIIDIALQDHTTAGYRPVLTIIHAAASSAFHGLALLGVGK